MAINREQFLRYDDKHYTIVKVPALGGQEVRLRTLTIAEQVQVENLSKETDDKKRLTFFVKTCCVDDHGNQLFTDDDVDLLWTRGTECILSIHRAAVDFNSLPQSHVETVAKN